MWLDSESDEELGIVGSSSVKTKKMPGGTPTIFRGGELGAHASSVPLLDA